MTIEVYIIKNREESLISKHGKLKFALWFIRDIIGNTDLLLKPIDLGSDDDKLGFKVWRISSTKSGESIYETGFIIHINKGD